MTHEAKVVQVVQIGGMGGGGGEAIWTKSKRTAGFSQENVPNKTAYMYVTSLTGCQRKGNGPCLLVMNPDSERNSRGNSENRVSLKIMLKPGSSQSDNE